MFRQFTWKHKANSGLNFATAQGFFLVVSRKSDGFGGNTLKSVVNETVHDRHSTTGDTSIWVYLFQYFVDVGAVAFYTSLSPLARVFLGLGAFACVLGRCFCHIF